MTKPQQEERIPRGQAWDPTNNFPSYMVGPDGRIIASSEVWEGIVTAHIDPDREWMVYGHGEPGTHDVQWILTKHRRPDLYCKEDTGEGRLKDG